MKDNQKLWIIIAAILAVVLIGAIIWLGMKNSDLQKDNKNLEELSVINTEDWENELNALTIQYEGFQQTLSNDSLLNQLEIEKLRVQRLQEELKTVKATDTKRINELQKEIASLRKIMYSYVVQIDSLNRINEQLHKENKEVKQQYQQATQTVAQLTQAKEVLTETVQIAAKLNASFITFRGLDKKGKEKKKIKDFRQLEFQFTINENVTAPRGEKDIYIRIMKPDDDVLVKSPGNVFPFEGKNITYSVKRTIEYTGEEVRLNMYWDVEETLLKGTYRVDIFADGNRIGSNSFNLDK